MLHYTFGSFDNDLAKLQPNEEGLYQIEDMLYNQEQLNELLNPENELRGGAVKNHRWPNGIVPYKIDAYASSHQRQMVADAVAYINSNFQGCLKIR